MNRPLLLLILLIVLLSAGCQAKSDPADQAFLQPFMGSWLHEENGETYTLVLKDNIETTGVYQSETLTRSEFKVESVDKAENSIVVHGFSEDLTQTGNRGKTEYYSKLVLKDNGNKLLYIYDYKNAKVESEWHR